ncbi:MAG: hypothetical protein AB7E72_00940 [Lysobacterales bacterium]
MGLMTLLRWTLDLLQLRGTPADAPPSPLLLAQLLILDLISSVFYLQALGTDLVFDVLLGRMLLNVVMVYAVMRVFNRTPRFLQTLIAMYAVSALLTFILLPIASALVRSQGDSPDLGLQFLQLGFLSLLLWSIVVNAHILRHALSLKFWLALPLSLGLFMLFNEIAALMFPFE